MYETSISVSLEFCIIYHRKIREKSGNLISLKMWETCLKFLVLIFQDHFYPFIKFLCLIEQLLLCFVWWASVSLSLKMYACLIWLSAWVTSNMHYGCFQDGDCFEIGHNMKAKRETAGKKWLRDDDLESCLLVRTSGDILTKDLMEDQRRRHNTTP